MTTKYTLNMYFDTIDEMVDIKNLITTYKELINDKSFVFNELHDDIKSGCRFKLNNTPDSSESYISGCKFDKFENLCDRCDPNKQQFCKFNSKFISRTFSNDKFEFNDEMDDSTNPNFHKKFDEKVQNDKPITDDTKDTEDTEDTEDIESISDIMVNEIFHHILNEFNKSKKNKNKKNYNFYIKNVNN